MLKKKLFSWLKRDKAEDIVISEEKEQGSSLSVSDAVSEDQSVADIIEETPALSEEPREISQIDSESDLSELDVPPVVTPMPRQPDSSPSEEVVAPCEQVQLDSTQSQIAPEVQASAPVDSMAFEKENTSSSVNEATPSNIEIDKASAPKKSVFQRLKQGLKKTRLQFTDSFLSLFQHKKIDEDLFEALEEQLLVADVGMDTTEKLIGELTQQASRRQLKDASMLYDLFKEQLKTILSTVEKPLDWQDQPKQTRVLLMVGVNGVGKTTTIGKLAKQFQAQGLSVMLAAGDTFRAAAVEQLKVWGERNKIPVVAQPSGSDSASVVFDAYASAQAKGVDVLIADTAGRLQNKAHLMNELKKIVRVLKKINPEAPHEIMLTLDAGTGQNAVSQAKLFHEAVGLTGITLSKLDGTAKGGVIFAIADQFKIPIRYIGVGEQIDDLQAFAADAFIEALFQKRSG
ncbi:MAG: signal recognition particle-docking protein FtsY [Shewanellaceae bacterium]|nr:signal recognition particle-docking protein FtsY [Shewanellaceae bacterium]